MRLGYFIGVFVFFMAIFLVVVAVAIFRGSRVTGVDAQEIERARGALAAEAMSR